MFCYQIYLFAFPPEASKAKEIKKLKQGVGCFLNARGYKKAYHGQIVWAVLSCFFFTDRLIAF